MGLIVLLTIGVVAGWVVSVVAKQDGLSGILANSAIGSVGSIGIGALGADGSLLSGIGPVALIVGVLGSLIFLIAALLVREHVGH